MKLDVTVNENSPSSPSVDISNPALTPTESNPNSVFHGESFEDTAGTSIGSPSPTEPSATPATPIFTPTPSQTQPSLITPTPMSLDTNGQSINVIDTTTTTILSLSHMYPQVDDPISLTSDQLSINSAEDPNRIAISDNSNKSFKADLTPVGNQTRLVAINITKGPFSKETNSQAVKKIPSLRQDEASSQSLSDTQKNDSYCWSCHEGGNVVCCDSCPRVFHLKCAHIETDPPEDREWLCAICSRLRSTKRRARDPANLTELLGFVLKKLKFEGTEQFQQEVKEEIAPGYREIVFHPIDLCKIERNLASYESTLHLRYDVEWLLHNCIIYNGNKHSLSKTARQIIKLCRMELNEIECCANCYKLSCIATPSWFSQVCDPPHSVVMAENKEVRGNPSWPGKLINKAREKCDIRFFGKKHARVSVPAVYVYPLKDLEHPNPPPTSKTTSLWPEAMNELKLYQSNLREWLLLHPFHKMVAPEINENVVFSPPCEKPNSSEETVGDAGGQRTSKGIVKLEELQSKPVPAHPPIMDTLYPNSDPTPIALFASSNPPIPRVSKEPESTFRRVQQKDLFLGPDAQTNHLKSETASDDDNDDPSFDMFRINQKHPGRRKRPGTAVDSKQKSKKIIFSPAPNRGGISSRGRGKKTETTGRKLLNYQFPPDSLNDELKSNLKRDLLPSVQVSHPRLEPVNELMDRNLSLSLKHFDMRSIEETEEEGIQSKFYKMFVENFDSLMLDIIADLNSGQMEQIQKILKDIVTREVSNRNQIYQQVYDNIREDMQRLIEQCHDVAKIEVERQSNQIQMECEKRMDDRVSDTKKTTWCSYCWDEAYYNCCWNVNYCSEKCQKIHWPEHKPHCIQMLNTPAPTELLGPSDTRARPFETPTSSRNREEDQSLDIMSKKPHPALTEPEVTPHKRKISVDVMRENMNQEDPLISRSSILVERDRPPDQKPLHRFTAPSHATPYAHQENAKIETYPSIIPPSMPSSHYTQLKSALTTSVPTGDSSTATTPVYVKGPSLSISSSSGQITNKEHLDQFPRGVRYAPLSISAPHQSPRGQQAPQPVLLSSALSQMETSIPNAVVNSKSMPTSSGQHKEAHGAHPAPSTPHKRVRETVPTRAGAQSPHPVVNNPVIFSAPIEGHGPQQASFIIHPGGPSVPGAPTTPTSNQAKALQQAFHTNIGQHNLYQLMNGDVPHNFMMRYPYPPTQGQIIPNQGTLQPNPHTMTPRPHDL